MCNHSKTLHPRARALKGVLRGTWLAIDVANFCPEKLAKPDSSNWDLSKSKDVDFIPLNGLCTTTIKKYRHIPKEKRRNTLVRICLDSKATNTQKFKHPDGTTRV